MAWVRVATSKRQRNTTIIIICPRPIGARKSPIWAAMNCRESARREKQASNRTTEVPTWSPCAVWRGRVWLGIVVSGARVATWMHEWSACLATSARNIPKHRQCPSWFLPCLARPVKMERKQKVQSQEHRKIIVPGQCPYRPGRNRLACLPDRRRRCLLQVVHPFPLFSVLRQMARPSCRLVQVPSKRKHCLLQHRNLLVQVDESSSSLYHDEILPFWKLSYNKRRPVQEHPLPMVDHRQCPLSTRGYIGSCWPNEKLSKHRRALIVKRQVWWMIQVMISRSPSPTTSRLTTAKIAVRVTMIEMQCNRMAIYLWIGCYPGAEATRKCFLSTRVLTIQTQPTSSNDRTSKPTMIMTIYRQHHPHHHHNISILNKFFVHSSTIQSKWTGSPNWVETMTVRIAAVTWVMSRQREHRVIKCLHVCRQQQHRPSHPPCPQLRTPVPLVALPRRHWTTCSTEMMEKTKWLFSIHWMLTSNVVNKLMSDTILVISMISTWIVWLNRPLTSSSISHHTSRIISTRQRTYTTATLTMLATFLTLSPAMIWPCWPSKSNHWTIIITPISQIILMLITGVWTMEPMITTKTTVTMGSVTIIQQCRAIHSTDPIPCPRRTGRWSIHHPALKFHRKLKNDLQVPKTISANRICPKSSSVPMWERFVIQRISSSLVSIFLLETCD